MGKVWATSDWHGCGKVADKVINFLQPDDILYFLGDACDRGEDGIRLLKWLLEDPRVRMIKGNHDEMLQFNVPKMINVNEENFIDYEVNNWIYKNGGLVTWEHLKNDPEITISWIINSLEKLPLELKYKSPVGHTIIMEHAGYSPFNIPYQYHDPLWDRKHFHDKWNGGREYGKYLEVDKTYLVHGHTPVQYLKYYYGYYGQKQLTTEEVYNKRAWNKNHYEMIKEKPTVIRYCDEHKFDIDMCTIVSDRIALLNLDTFEEVYFDA